MRRCENFDSGSYFSILNIFFRIFRENAWLFLIFCDEIYQLGQNSGFRENVEILTSFRE